MPRLFRLFAVVALLLTSVAHGRDIKFEVTIAPEMDDLFQRTNGWIGADGAYSIPLSKNKSVWLFSDTFVGKVEEGRRVNAKMINNTVAIQEHGKTPEFYYPTNAKGEAESFIKPNDGRGFFWLFHGTRNQDGLFFSLRHVEIVDHSSVFGFRGFGNSMARVRNPDDHPSKWKVEQLKFPYDKRDEGEIIYASAVMKDKGYVYIYGNKVSPDKKERGLVVARVPEKKFGAFDEWRFYANGKWQKDWEAVTYICPDAPAEAGVAYWPALKKYVFIYTPGIWGKIVMRTADNPVGPWSEPIPLYEAPEMKYPAKVFAYAGKCHPQISVRKDELIVSYAANSFDFHEIIRDARLYWPRFVRVKMVKE
ncbi:MAG: DUF4185 domain-containing protein [Limisphaerales bacterium]